MKTPAIVAATLMLSGCIGQYHPTSAYPPTPDRKTAFDFCVNEAFKETPALPGLIANVAVGPARTEIQDRCMFEHGWSRN